MYLKTKKPIWSSQTEIEKSFLQNPTCLHDKSTREYRARGNITQHNEGIKEKPIASIILNGEMFGAIPLMSGRRHQCSLSLLLFYIVVEVLARAIRQEKEIKGIQIGRMSNYQYLQMTWYYTL